MKQPPLDTGLPAHADEVATCKCVGIHLCRDYGGVEAEPAGIVGPQNCDFCFATLVLVITQHLINLEY